MVLISYDIADDKKRTKFNKYIRKFGTRLQYSVYEIENSDRILQNILADLNNKFIKSFDETDSVCIFKLSNSCEVIKYGYAKHEDTDLLIVE
ncbi:MAG: CRISPR-associated endonuclease Cas2 [Eubacteriales bacterium]|nr:CRISPR-associated endonuclease Cas2 [Eubacteriales bacterium]